MMNAERGALIVLEGLDRSGKTTQAAQLLQHFLSNGRKAKIQRFPDRTEQRTGPLIDQFLRTATDVNDSREVMHLLFSANRWALAERIRQDIANGVTLIVDRYSFSGVTYSMAKGLDKRLSCFERAWCRWIALLLLFPTACHSSHNVRYTPRFPYLCGDWVCQPEVGLPRPDLVLFFDIDPTETSTRSGFGDEVMEKSDFQQKVYTNILDIFNDNYWKKINAADTIENVHSSVVKEVEKLGASTKTASLGSMDLSDFGL